MDEQKLDVTAQQPDAALHAQTEEITNEALPEALLEQQAAQAELSQAIEASAEELQPEQAEQTTQPERVTVVDIRFRNNAKTYFFDPGELRPVSGDHVIIETARGDEYGICAGACHEVKASEIVPPLRKVLRMASAQDERINRDNQEKEKRAFEVCQQKIAAHGLEMQLVSSECAFDGSKLLFFFTAEGRVDFRELVKDLASVFRTRIELRQIGVRDKAKMVGGLGVCGRPFCCKEFLDDFQPVSIKMAKTQNLSLNPTKISGTCGRLMCCLKYEQEAYEDLIKTAPKVESFVDTADGRGTVIEVNLLRQSVRVRMEDHPETIGTYKNTDIYILRSGKARKNDPPIPRDFAPISSKPRPVQKKEAFFEELPEVIYPDAVAVIAPETQAAEEETGDAAEEAGKNANRRRRRGGRRTKPAGERPQEAAVPEKTAPKEQPRADAPRRERPKKERPPQQDKPERKPAPQKQERPEKAEASSSDGQPKPRRRRRRSGGPRKPSGEGQTPKAE